MRSNLLHIPTIHDDDLEEYPGFFPIASFFEARNKRRKKNQEKTSPRNPGSTVSKKWIVALDWPTGEDTRRRDINPGHALRTLRRGGDSGHWDRNRISKSREIVTHANSDPSSIRSPASIGSILARLLLHHQYPGRGRLACLACLACLGKAAADGGGMFLVVTRSRGQAIESGL